MLRFDASVDLTEDTVLPGMPPDVAVEQAREALGALPSAGCPLNGAAAPRPKLVGCESSSVGWPSRCQRR